MRNLLLVIAVGIAVVVAQSGCQRQSEAAPPAVERAAPKAAVDADAVDVDAAMLANVRLEEVRERALPKVLTATGKVQFNEERTARILAPLAGQVVDLAVRVGDSVEKDQVLFSLKSREVAALVSDYLQALRDQDLAQKTFNMTRDLYEHQAASRIALQQSESDWNRTRTQTARAEEALRVLGLDPKQVTESSGLRALVPVRSPIAGTVVDRAVTAGQFVQSDSTALVTIEDLRTVWVMVDVFERDLHLVRPGQRVQVTAAAYPDRKFTAQVDRISDRVDPETRTIKVRLLVSNPGNLLKPEMFLTASLVLNERTPGLSVPEKALFTEGDRSYAFVALGEGKFQRRQVTATPHTDGRMLVVSGIKAGERVVSDGALLLRYRQLQQAAN